MQATQAKDERDALRRKWTLYDAKARQARRILSGFLKRKRNVGRKLEKLENYTLFDYES